MWWTSVAWALPLTLVDTPAFEASAKVERGAEVGPTVFDFDGDGDWDVLYAEKPFNDFDELHLMIQTSPGVFVDEGASRNLLDPVLDTPVRAMLPADLDHDGLIDIFVVGSEHVTVFWNDGATFTADELAAGGNREGAVLMDVDEDGWLDVIVNDDDLVDWFRNDHAATPRSFTDNQLQYFAPGGTGFLTAADANHDGFTDLFVHADHNLLGWHNNTNGGLVHIPSLMTANGLEQNGSSKGVMVACDHDHGGSVLSVMPTEAGTGSDPDANGFFRWDGASYTFDTKLSDKDQIRTGLCAHLDEDALLDVMFGSNFETQLVEDQGSSVDVLDSRVLTMASADLDDDGDLDVIAQAGPTRVEGIRLYENDQVVDVDHHLQVSVRTRLTPCGDTPERTRVDWGAQVVLVDGGTPRSDLQEILGGMGRGQLSWPVTHFAGIDPSQAVTVRVFPMADRTGTTDPGATRPYIDFEGVVPSAHRLPTGAQRFDVTLPLCEPLETGDTGTVGLTGATGATGDTATPGATGTAGNTGSAPTTGATGDTGTLPTTAFTADTASGGSPGPTGSPGPSPTADTAAPTGPTAGTDGTPAAGSDGKAAAGCGCHSASAPWGALFALLGAAAVSRRRRRPSPASATR